MKACEILENLGMVIGSASKRDVLTIARLADDEGTLQPEDMRRVFRSESHGSCDIRQALILAGCGYEYYRGQCYLCGLVGDLVENQTKCPHCGRESRFTAIN